MLLRLFVALGSLSFFENLEFLLPIDGALEALVFGDLIVSILTLRDRASFAATNMLLSPLRRSQQSQRII